ncbi:MAG TPA: hypothetical protein VFZ78_07030 [Flavisolibacter sp.]
MSRVFQERDFPDTSLKCDACGWSGKGNESHIIDFYGVSAVQQVECPECKNYLGDLKADDNGRGRSNAAFPFD